MGDNRQSYVDFTSLGQCDYSQIQLSHYACCLTYLILHNDISLASVYRFNITTMLGNVFSIKLHHGIWYGL